MYLFDREKKMKKNAWIKNQESCQRRLGRSDSGKAGDGDVKEPDAKSRK